MSISKKTVEHMAWLAKIDLSEEEKELFAKQLSDVIAYFEKISQLDTRDVEPTFHVHDLVDVLREDEVTPSLAAEEALRNAPRVQGKFIKAPKMVG